MMEFLVSNNLNKDFLNVLLRNYFDRLFVNQDMIIMFDRNIVQLQIHVQIQSRQRDFDINKHIFFQIKHTFEISFNEFLKFFFDKFFNKIEICVSAIDTASRFICK